MCVLIDLRKLFSSGMHKFRKPDHPGGKILYRVIYSVWISNAKLAYHHPYGAQNIDVVYTFLENFCTRHTALRLMQELSLRKTM
jgi:hypothetical protein